MQRSALCRSRRELSNAYFVANLASIQPRTSPVKFARPSNAAMKPRLREADRRCALEVRPRPGAGDIGPMPEVRRPVQDPGQSPRRARQRQRLGRAAQRLEKQLIISFASFFGSGGAPRYLSAAQADKTASWKKKQGTTSIWLASGMPITLEDFLPVLQVPFSKMRVFECAIDLPDSKLLGNRRIHTPRISKEKQHTCATEAIQPSLAHGGSRASCRNPELVPYSLSVSEVARERMRIS